MRILVFAEDAAWKELCCEIPGIEWIRAEDEHTFRSYKEADVYFNLYNNAASTDYSGYDKCVIINSVTETLRSSAAGNHVLRINGWPGFLKRETWEVAGTLNSTSNEIFTLLQRKIIPVPDEPGFISARIIAMVINEAFFAIEEKISSENEIDTAMKLGTNYPYGPFEWAKIIGVQQIYFLLKKLSISDSRYIPAGILENKMKQS